ncbi:MAG: DUF2680 domain-containing protein [Firmicutes bacterium]|nr:DUF2680 domain-containing protein [Bacillota bacterium]
MKKRLLLVVVVVLILALAVPSALAITDSQHSKLHELYQQEHNLHQQIIDAQSEAGIITAEDAAEMKEHLSKQWEYRQQLMQEGNYGFGHGLRRRGNGIMRGGGCYGHGRYYQ